MPYQVQIRDTKTGEVRTVTVFNGWNDTGSLDVWQNRMCDCNCHGYFDRKMLGHDRGTPMAEQHEGVAYRFGHCEHGGKRSRYEPLKAILPDGREISLTSAQRSAS